MTFGRVTVLVGIALLVMVANVAVSILYMVVYGHVIDPVTRRHTTKSISKRPRPIAASSRASR